MALSSLWFQLRSALLNLFNALSQHMDPNIGTNCDFLKEPFPTCLSLSSLCGKTQLILQVSAQTLHFQLTSLMIYNTSLWLFDILPYQLSQRFCFIHAHNRHLTNTDRIIYNCVYVYMCACMNICTRAVVS